MKTKTVVIDVLGGVATLRYEVKGVTVIIVDHDNQEFTSIKSQEVA